MSTFQKAIKSLLQGVSQQLPAERLPGQLTSEVNMVSDPVTNLRRRPGIKMQRSFAWTGADWEHTLGWFTDIAGTRVHVLVNSNTGNIRILGEDYTELASLAGGEYLIAEDRSKIRATTVGNAFFLANVTRAPGLAYNLVGADPASSGFLYIVSGAFGRAYTVTVTYGSTVTTASYTTPGGSGSGDAAQTTPEFIAMQLHSQLSVDPNLSVVRDGPYVFIKQVSTAPISINTTVGTQYLITSKGGMVTAVGNLPARLPAVADGYIVRVGSGDGAQYYKYNHAKTEWLETGDWASPTSITNVPISIEWSGTAWVLNTTAFEGRLAGDDSSNPAHEFMKYGITGMGTHQGRLILMSGPLVSLSASNRPRRFFRSTVTSVIASDAIEIGSSMNSSAAYEWATTFQKDLVLHSRMYQAVIPTGNTALTPNNATVVPTSAFETDTTCGPINLGRTLMYCNPRSEDFFGVLEMIPSQYTDSQYTSQDATPHLPKYMPGRCRFSASSTVASIAVFAPSGDPKTLLVHEYQWDGDTKQQQAWHQWTFPYEVAAAYFTGEVIVLAFVKNGQIILGSVDSRAGSVNKAGERRPFLDLNFSATIVDHVITLPSWLTAFDPAILPKLKAVAGTGELAGELVGTTVEGSTLRTVLSWPSGVVGIGLPYYSGFIPTPPTMRDYKDNIIYDSNATILRYIIGTKNTSDYDVSVSDAYSEVESVEEPALTFSSPELELGRGLFSDIASNIVPCRTDMRTTSLEISTSGVGELNVRFIEYVGKASSKIQRR